MQIRGTFIPQENIFEEHKVAEAGDQDILDSVAVYTLKNGGNVYTMPSDEMPGGSSLAAIFRY